MKKLLVLMLVLGTVSTASAVNLTFSTDGSTDLADGATVNIAVGASQTFYLRLGAPDDAGYVTYYDIALPVAATLPADTDYTIYAAAGNLASVVDYTTGSLYDMELTAADTTASDNIPAAGNNFSWVITISGSAATDGSDDFYMINTDPDQPGYLEDKRVNIHIVPEPATMALLGLGGLFLLRRRKR